MGDPACWMDQVCQACGRLIEAEQRADDTCPHCGEAREPDPAENNTRPR